MRRSYGPRRPVPAWRTWTRRPASLQQRVDHGGVDDRPSGDDLALGQHDVVDVCDPPLEQVGQSVAAVLQQAYGVPAVRVLRKDHDPDLRMCPEQSAGPLADQVVVLGDHYTQAGRRLRHPLLSPAPGPECLWPHLALGGGVAAATLQINGAVAQVSLARHDGAGAVPELMVALLDLGFGFVLAMAPLSLLGRLWLSSPGSCWQWAAWRLGSCRWR
jgi:hypothetical protein